METENKFYVYALLDPRKAGKFCYGEYHFNYEPFYIGKGCNYRMYAHACASELNRDRNPFKKRKINKILKLGLEIISVKIKSNMAEADALLFEEKLIKIIGRHNSKTGPLTNCDDGGTNGPIMTEEIKHKISVAQTERYKTEKHPWIGRKHSEISKEKIKKNHWKGGFKMSEIGKEKISQAMKGRKILSSCNTYLATDPSGNKIDINSGLKQFCKENNLALSCVRRVLSGDRTHHKHWSFTKIYSVNSGKAKKYTCTDPNGKTYDTECLSKFCKQHNLVSTLMTKVAKGIRQHHKEWKCVYRS